MATDRVTRLESHIQWEMQSVPYSYCCCFAVTVNQGRIGWFWLHEASCAPRSEENKSIKKPRLKVIVSLLC